MRVVTVENFGKLTTNKPGYIYEGDGWLFRFGINSEAHFFKDQLPNMVRVLGIDIRQIMRLVLYGRPGAGLFDAHVLVSFEEPPTSDELGQLKSAVPESLSGGHSEGILGELFLEFVKNSTRWEKHAVHKTLNRNGSAVKKQQRANDTTRYLFPYLYRTAAGFSSGNLLRLNWEDELSPSFADWCNVNFYLSEALRDLYNPQNLTRLEFRAIPDTEHLYDIDAEVLVEGPMKLHPIRTKSKTHRRSKNPGSAPPSEAKAVVKFTPMPAPLEGLDNEDLQLITGFNGLPLLSQVHIWQKYIARHFK